MLRSIIDQAVQCERAGAWNQALAHYEQAFARLPSEGSATQAIELLRWIGTVRRERGDLELAEEAYEASLVIAQANQLSQHEAAALNCLGILEQLRGRIDAADHLYRRAKPCADKAGDQHLAAMIDQNLGILANIRGNVREALHFYGSALARYRQLGDELTAARALSNMGMAHVDLEEWEAAERCFGEAAELAHRADDILMVGTVEMNRAELFLQRSHFDSARESCRRSLAVFSQLRSKPGIGEAYKYLGILHRETGYPEQASAHFAMGLGLAETSQDSLLEAEIQLEWAQVHLEAGQGREGILYLNRALRRFGDLQARREVLDIQRRFEKAEGRYVTAVQRWSADRLANCGAALVEHSERVALYSCEIAEILGVSGWEYTMIRVGALIHDIGNTELPSSHIVHPDFEAAAALHTIAGHVLVEELAFPVEVCEIVRHHHEAWSGDGYPDRLRGAAIPRLAQIVGVADLLDSLVEAEPASDGTALARAFQRIRREFAWRFDPVVLQAAEDALLSPLQARVSA